MTAARSAIMMLVFNLAFASTYQHVHAQKSTLQNSLRISTFDVDATPPPGSWLTYDSLKGTWDLALRAKGIVLMGSGLPIVLCCVDWIGIANEGHDEFRKSLALAAGTTIERVAVQTLHQHDAPTCDFGAEEYLLKNGLNPIGFRSSFQREVIRRLSAALKNSLDDAKAVTHFGYGTAEVEKLASNRRILGPDGKILYTRTSATKDSIIRNVPEGLIDPQVSLISFWNKEIPLAVLSYYAVHPQSYYRTGISNPDIPGIARFFRQLELPDVPHILFNGAGGNITAGKYNDGSHENRLVLAQRLADGMKKAWQSTLKKEISPKDVQWAVEPVSLPPKKELAQLPEILKKQTIPFRANNVSKIGWFRRQQAGKKIDITCLSILNTRIIHLPGEPFIEFQLAAKALRRDLFVAVAGYGDYGPGYIGTAISYSQGGYETGQASAVTADAEGVLLKAIEKLLKR